MDKEEAILKVKELLGLVPLKNSPFVYINGEMKGMPTSPNAVEEAEKLIEEWQIGDIINKERIIENLKDEKT